jgi:response regulator of citrate/malate metabolism
MTKPKNSMSIAVAIVEDDVPAREILAGWIRNADGFRCVGEFDDAESALARLHMKSLRSSSSTSTCPA